MVTADTVTQRKTQLKCVLVHGVYHRSDTAADEVAVFVELHIAAVGYLLYKNNNFHLVHLFHLTPIHLAMIFF